MAANLRPFSGKHCRYHLRGRCLYEEVRNPGFHREHLCKELRRMEEHFDGLLQRMEAFNLTESQSLKILQEALSRMEDEGGCLDRIIEVPGNGRDGEAEKGIDCVYAMGHVCLLCLPACEGVCRHYETLEPSMGRREGKSR